MVEQTEYENILTEVREGGVALITLNRPKALNALNSALAVELHAALTKFNADDAVFAIVLTGSLKAFAAGADIKEMSTLTFPDTFMSDFLKKWQDITKFKKPLIGAVNGFALGGGCELAMMCDILIAGEKAKFGQPEINLGIIPGMGGTQRLVRAIGKSRAMELALTGDFLDAASAKELGLVSRVVEPEKCVDEAIEVGLKIAKKSRPSVAMAKECINEAFEQSLSQGLNYELRTFQSLFATKDQKVGMEAFISKQQPEWTHQ